MALWVRSGSSEPELELVTGSVELKTEERSGNSQGVRPPSKEENGFPRKGWEGERVDNMAAGQSFWL